MQRQLMDLMELKLSRIIKKICSLLNEMHCAIKTHTKNHFKCYDCDCKPYTVQYYITYDQEKQYRCICIYLYIKYIDIVGIVFVMLSSCMQSIINNSSRHIQCEYILKNRCKSMLKNKKKKYICIIVYM